MLFFDLCMHTQYMFNFYNKTLKSHMSFTLCSNAWWLTSCSWELHCKMSCQQATCKEAYISVKNWTWKAEIEISSHEPNIGEVMLRSKIHTFLKPLQITCFVYNLNAFAYCLGRGLIELLWYFQKVSTGNGFPRSWTGNKSFFSFEDNIGQHCKVTCLQTWQNPTP